MAKLPPLPVGVPPGHSYWNDWYEKLRKLINDGSQTHNTLLGLQGGTTGQYYHLTSAEQAKVTKLDSGTWTGTISLTSNVSSSSWVAGFYLRVGDIVHATCVIKVSATTAAATGFELSLPVTSNLTAIDSLKGSMSIVGGPNGEVWTDVANDLAIVTWTATTTSNTTLQIYFTYKVQ